MPIYFWIKTASFRLFNEKYTGRITLKRPMTTLLWVSRPMGRKRALIYFLETADAKQLFDNYLNHWKRRALIARGGFIRMWGCLHNRDARLIRTKTHSKLALIREGMVITTRALNRIIYGKWSSGYKTLANDEIINALAPSPLLCGFFMPC